MNYKMPYYMAYPDLDYIDEERMSNKDIEYMKSLYPRIAKRVLPHIEKECKRLEYEGSLIYDAYPDKVMLSLLCGRVYENILADDNWGEITNKEELHWLRDMIEILTYQELCKRREQWRKTKRRWY